VSEDFDKYLAIANDDIQRVNNISELKSYVASILYDNDKKGEQLQQKENIIKEVRDILEPLIALEGTMTTKGMSKLLEILDKENKE